MQFNKLIFLSLVVLSINHFKSIVSESCPDTVSARAVGRITQANKDNAVNACNDWAKANYLGCGKCLKNRIAITTKCGPLNGESFDENGDLTSGTFSLLTTC